MAQFDMFDTEEQRAIKTRVDENQLILLPVSPLAEKFGEEDPSLTDCEFEIMQMILSGYSIGEIALKIFLSIQGVKYRLSNIYWKFGVKNRLGLIRKTSEKGIQFRRKTSGVKHTFHNQVNLRAHERLESNEKNQ